MNSNSLPEATPPYDLKGGEPLAGSGFEAEEPDRGFSPDAIEAEEA